MNRFNQLSMLQSRRRFLTHTGMGLGAAAFASLIPRAGQATPIGTHFAAKAKRIIFLFMAGAPSQIDLFDYKSDLHKQFKQELPKSVSQGQRVTAMTAGLQQIVCANQVQIPAAG